jgi:hypothetical protein
MEQAGSQFPCNFCAKLERGDFFPVHQSTIEFIDADLDFYTGHSDTINARLRAEESCRLCERHRLGPALRVPSRHRRFAQFCNLFILDILP